jgi:hypothetical protein
LSVLSWSSAMIGLRGAMLQLRLDLVDGRAPVVALWELLEEERRRAAMALLAAMIAQTCAAELREGGGDE